MSLINSSRFLLFVFFSLSLSLSAQDFPDKKSNDWNQKMNQAIRAEKFTEAAEYCDKILKKHPKSQKTLLSWHLIHLQLKEYEKINAHPMPGNNLQGTDFTLWFGTKLSSAMALNDKERVHTLVEEHKLQIENSPKASHLVGIFFIYQEDYKSALPYLKSSLERGGSLRPDLLETISLAYSELGYFEQSKKYMETRLELDNNCLFCHLQMAYLAENSGDFPKAIEEYDHLIENATHYDAEEKLANWYLAKGFALRNLNRLNDAIDLYESLLEKEMCDSVMVAQGLYESFLRRGDLEKAEFWMKISTRDSRDTYSDLVNRGMIAVKKKNYTEAEIALSSALSIDSTLSNAPIIMTYIFCERDRDFDKALAYLQLFEQKLTVKKDYYGQMGYLYSESSEFKKAIFFLNNALEAEPFHPYLYSNRGNVRRQLKDFEGARKDFEKSVELDPKNSYVFFNMARLNYDLGEWEQFCENMKKARELGFEETYFYMDHIKFPDAECP